MMICTVFIHIHCPSSWKFTKITPMGTKTVSFRFSLYYILLLSFIPSMNDTDISWPKWIQCHPMSLSPLHPFFALSQHPDGSAGVAGLAQDAQARHWACWATSGTSAGYLHGTPQNVTILMGKWWAIGIWGTAGVALKFGQCLAKSQEIQVGEGSDVKSRTWETWPSEWTSRSQNDELLQFWVKSQTNNSGTCLSDKPLH